MKKRNVVVPAVLVLLLVLALLFIHLGVRTERDDEETSLRLEAMRDNIKQFEPILPIEEPKDEPLPEKDVTEPDITEPDITEPEPDVPDPVTPIEPSVPSDGKTEEQTPPVQTLDFDKLWEVNPDICAWLEIEGTNIDYPVLISYENDEKYLSVAYDGTKYRGGSLFLQSEYNGGDFEDEVTVIYGHNMYGGYMFGHLQEIYSLKENFTQNSKVTVYLPDAVKHYRIFAAVPYSDLHILHTYDFSNTYWYCRFFGDIKDIRAIGANTDEALFPEAHDRVIILSVCLGNSSKGRYLVMAVLEEDLADNEAYS